MAKVILSEQEKERIISEKLDSNFFLDQMLKKFKKQVEQEERLEIVRRKMEFLPKSIRRKEKSKRAKIRLIKLNKNKKRNKKFQKMTEK